jgi:hypothetical protein
MSGRGNWSGWCRVLKVRMKKGVGKGSEAHFPEPDVTPERRHPAVKEKQDVGYVAEVEEVVMSFLQAGEGVKRCEVPVCFRVCCYPIIYLLDVEGYSYAEEHHNLSSVVNVIGRRRFADPNRGDNDVGETKHEGLFVLKNPLLSCALYCFLLELTCVISCRLRRC